MGGWEEETNKLKSYNNNGNNFDLNKQTKEGRKEGREGREANFKLSSHYNSVGRSGLLS